MATKKENEVLAAENNTTVTTDGLTTWKNEPSLEDLKNDLNDASIDHSTQVTLIDTWLDNMNVEGTAKTVKVKGKSAMQPKLIRKQAEWRYAALSEPFLSTEDIYNIEPVSDGDKDAAIQNSLILNNQFNTKLDKVKLIDDTVRAAVNEGTLIFRTGWANEEETVEISVPAIEYTPNLDPQAPQKEMKLEQLYSTSPDDYNQLPEEIKGAHTMFMQTGQAYIGNITGYTIEEEVKILKNHPTVEVCDYRDIILDPTAKSDPSKIEFAVYKFETSKSELEKSSINYQNLDNIVMSSASPLMDPDSTHTNDTNFSFKDEPRKKLVAYEYWGFYDINGTGVTEPFVATWIGNTMIRMEENPFPDKKIPFVIVPYLPKKGSMYGEPDGALLEDNQKIIGAVTRGMIDIMARSANGQIGMREDALDVTNKRRYNDGLDYEFNPTIDPKTAIINHTYPEIPQSAQFMLDMNNADAESMTGVKAFHGGISGRALGDNVGGIKSALDATAKRELGILRRIAEGYKQLGRKIIAMNAVFLSDVEVVRVTNDQFIEIRKDDLAGNFDLKLSISTAEADNEKAQELSFMLQTVGPNTDPQMLYMIMADIARLRKMPELAKKLENYQPQPDPMAQKKAELEIALLEAQIFNEQAKGAENNVDVGLKEAKTRTENAKARNLDSASDTQDLDFLEKEQGLPHAREMEKKDVDRKADLDKLAVDALLTPEQSQVQQ